MAEARVIVVGSCNMDIVAQADRVPAGGETVIGNRYWMVMGGKGANQAVAARLLGAESIMVGRVGNDVFGQRMLDTLRSFEVNCDHVKLDDDSDSGVAVIMVDERAENSIIVVPGANMQIKPADVDAVKEQIQAADVLLLQLEIPLDAIEHAMDVAREGDTLCILNPAPARMVPDRLLGKADILTPNEHEARLLTGMAADTAASAEVAGKALLEKGVEQVIVTMGAKGALLVNHNQTQYIPSTKVNAVDTTGAGDAFMGGLGIALAEGKSLEEAARFASVVAALSTTRPGATSSMPTRDEVEAFSTSLSK